MVKKIPCCKLYTRKIKTPKFSNDADDQLCLKVFLTGDVLPTSIFAGMAIEVHDEDDSVHNANSSSNNKNTY